MATLKVRLALVLYMMASATHLGTGRSLCAHIGGAGVFTDHLLSVSISSRQLQAHAASWLQNTQQQTRQLQSPITCSLHACSTKGTSLACQMQHVAELYPLQTGTVLLEPAMLLQHKQPPPVTAEGYSSSPQHSPAAIATRPSAASPSPISGAAASDSMMVKLAASCRLYRSSSSKPQQANHTVSDSVLQERHSHENTTADGNTTSTAQHQHAARQSNVVWTETIQLTLLQQHLPESVAAQSCPKGSTAIPVWLMPGSLALEGSGLPHSSSQGSNSDNAAAAHAQEQQHAAGWPHGTSTWASASPYDDQYDYEEWLEGIDDDTGVAGSSRPLVMLDLLLPDVEHWFVSWSNSTSNSSTGYSILAQPGAADGAGPASLAAGPGAAAVDVAATSSRIDVLWVRLGRLLLVGALIGVQLVWHHLKNTN